MLFGFVPALIDDYREMFGAWRKAGLKHFFLRPNYFCYSGTEARGLERYLYDNLHFFMSEGTRGADYDGAPCPATEFERYVVARALAFPKKTFDEIAEEYYAFFGDMAQSVRHDAERRRRSGEELLAKITDELHTKGIDMLDDTGLAMYFQPDAVRAKMPPRKLQEKGWRTSFDAPGLEGWRARDGFLRVTDATASFDKYSVEAALKERETIVLCRSDVPVAPGTRYKVGFDAKLGDGIGFAALKTVWFSAEGKKRIGAARVEGRSDSWQMAEYSFATPEACTNVSLYVTIGGDKPGACCWVDNIHMERIEMIPH